MGRDLNNDPMCGVRIISKNKLEEQQFRDLILEKIVPYVNEGMINICKYKDRSTHSASCSCNSDSSS